MSFPPSPQITSDFGVPYRVSDFSVPTIVQRSPLKVVVAAQAVCNCKQAEKTNASANATETNRLEK